MPTEGGASSLWGLGAPPHRTAPTGKVLASHGEQMSHPQSCYRWSGFPNGGSQGSGGGQRSQRLAALLPTPPASLWKTRPPAVISARRSSD